MQQRTEEWLQARLGFATASRFGDIIALGARGQYLQARTTYLQELVAERLTGQPVHSDPYVSNEMKWGIVNEQLGKNEYTMRTGQAIIDAPFVTHADQNIKAGASPDGFVGEDGLVEVKSPRTDNYLFKIFALQEVPDEYMAQIQGQMWITGRDWCDFIGSDSRLPKGLDIFVQRVMRDEAYIANLEAEVLKFLAEVDKAEATFRAMIKEGKPNAKRIA